MMKDLIYQSEMKKYYFAFILSISLTILAFLAVIFIKEKHMAIGVLSIAGLAQLVVQLMYFLHVNKDENEGWNLGALIFVAVLLLILIGGSGWIMYNLHMNMMPDLS